MSTEPDSPARAAQFARDPATAVEVIPPPAAERHDGWTRAKQAHFLRELAATHCVTTAARAVDMTRQSAYKLRNRLKGEPFDLAWHCAFRRKFDALAEAALERAIHGVPVPHFYKGQLIHTSRRYDERAAVALLALGQRLARPQRCLRAEEEGVDVLDFAALVERVELGHEQWAEVVYDDEAGEEEDDEAGEGEALDAGADRD